MAKSAAGIIAVAKRHIGEDYVLGARAPLGNRGWTGPWDCAEFASWCLFRATRILYGARPGHDPMRADAYTGYWAEQSQADGARIGLDEAVRIPGAMLLRAPAANRRGHIAISDGNGGTLEAHSSKRGVIAHTAARRRWDCGVLVPGVEYRMNDAPVPVENALDVIRVTQILMRGPRVRKIQQRLTRLGYAPGRADGLYGPQTAHAVMQFQADEGLVADGEVGPETLSALGLQKIASL